LSGPVRAARREPSNDAIVLGVLDAVERNPSVTQRSVARDLGIALGMVNAYLKRCLKKGLIKIGQVPPRRYAYYLTPRGMSEKSRLTPSYLCGDASKARAKLGWSHKVSFDALVSEMVMSDLESIRRESARRNWDD
jgi:DNA-binding MarR family transcriptional regulator